MASSTENELKKFFLGMVLVRTLTARGMLMNCRNNFLIDIHEKFAVYYNSNLKYLKELVTMEPNIH